MISKVFVNNSNNQVVLVDKNDLIQGTLDKTKAHTGKGILHRAVSVVIYRDKNGQKQILLQKRSQSKLLWPGFWSNTVCTHPGKDESLDICAVRRLKEELGIDIGSVDLKYIFNFIYQSSFNKDFSEHELDHVFMGKWDGKVRKNQSEVQAYKWVEFIKLISQMKKYPQAYTPWFHEIIKNPLISKNLL